MFWRVKMVCVHVWFTALIKIHQEFCFWRGPLKSPVPWEKFFREEGGTRSVHQILFCKTRAFCIFNSIWEKLWWQQWCRPFQCKKIRVMLRNLTYFVCNCILLNRWSQQDQLHIFTTMFAPLFTFCLGATFAVSLFIFTLFAALFSAFSLKQP